MTRRFARRRVAGVPAAATQSLQDALGELVLLREENARLSAAAHEPASLGRLVGRVRSLTSGALDGDRADDAAQLLVDGIVLCESLVQVCAELEHAIAAAKARLGAALAEREEREVAVGGLTGGG
jgi:hypothetical protein